MNTPLSPENVLDEWYNAWPIQILLSPATICLPALRPMQTL